MKYQLNSREEVEDFVRNEVLTTAEAMEILKISRARMSQLVKDGKLIPVKKLGSTSLFIRADIEEKKKELEAARKKYRPYDESK